MRGIKGDLMNKKTLQALKGSIRKWEKIVAGTGVDNGHCNCPLCKVFPIACLGCPVYEKTGFDDCAESPYQKWMAHNETEHSEKYPKKIECSRCKFFALKELKFLISLLPK
jgi:hypothetical protein